MNFKQKAIAALEKLKGDTTGIIAATIEDCQRVIGDIPEDVGWIPVAERLPEPEKRVMVMTTCADFYPCKGAVATIGSRYTTEFIEGIADHLIANGVTVQGQEE